MASGLLVCTALVALLLPLRAHAQFAGKAGATAQFESNSNVFDLNSGAPLPVGIHDSHRSDTFYAYGAQFDATYSWRRQQIYAAASTTEYEYQRFTDLNHNSYSIDTGLKWRLGEPLDGKVDVARSRTMVPFYNLSGSNFVVSAVTLSLITDQKETAQVGLRLNSRWKLEGSVSADRTTQPVVGAPQLELYQNSATTALDYLGVNGLTSGLTAGYMEGEYIGSAGTLFSPKFSQTTAGLLAKYKHFRTTFDGQIGYTRRDSDSANDNTSGFTGLIDIAQQVTPRTRVTVKADRAINNYVLNSGSEIDTDLGAGVLWQATYKSAFSLAYTFTYRDFPGQGNNPIGSKRVDIQESVTAGINYQPRRWLLIKPYYTALTRRSTFIGNHYSSTIFGVSVTVSTPDKPK
jgi:hypothetical protein